MKTVEAIIEMQGVGKRYHQGSVETQALNKIHFTVNANDFIALAGPSLIV